VHRLFEDRVVLLIEDDPLLLGALQRTFSAAGARVLPAANGAEGMKHFGASSPDVVVTDIIMPEAEGLETILAMKGVRPDVPILAISGGGRTPAGDFLAVARGLGADAALAKPFRSQQLLDAAHALLDGQTLADAA
jgi:DNA-binding response OmpR family regulator